MNSIIYLFILNTDPVQIWEVS